MARQNVIDIANELIGEAVPLDRRHAFLFGHLGPLGLRWSVAQVGENLVPSLRIKRLIELRRDPKNIENFDKLYFEKTKLIGSNVQSSTGQRLMQDIFGLDYTVNCYEGAYPAPDRQIHFDRKLNDVKIVPTVTSADVGRMMLVDLTLADQGIVSTNGTITHEAAVQARRICLPAPIPAQQYF